MATLRDITLTINLVSGEAREVQLREDAPELLALFAALASPWAENRFVQLPLDGGRRAWSFQTAKIVSVTSEPPVVIAAERVSATQPNAQLAATRAESSVSVRRPRFVIIDDFLSAQEHDELLAYALASEAQFEAGTVTESYTPEVRQNQVILDFGASVHSRLLENRLLIWFPLIAKRLGLPLFPLAQLESQLTAARDGHYFKTHADQSPTTPRALTCIYYLHREPRGFSGGELRLYDAIQDGGEVKAAETFVPVQAVANRLVVFASHELHEALPVRCPSGEFADSRFAVTVWLHASDKVDPQSRFGWGHFFCGVVAPQLRSVGS